MTKEELPLLSMESVALVFKIKRAQYKSLFTMEHSDKYYSYYSSYRKAHRDKYNEYDRNWKTNNPEKAKETSVKSVSKHSLLCPEQSKAKAACRYMQVPKGCRRHHWNYNDEFHTDIIILSLREHQLLHSQIKYIKDLSLFMDKNGNLLDTKQSHIDLIKHIKENMQ